MIFLKPKEPRLSLEKGSTSRALFPLTLLFASPVSERAFYFGGLQGMALCVLTKHRGRDLSRDAPFLSAGQMAVFNTLCLICHAASVRYVEGESSWERCARQEGCERN